jgi:hypothetical protein
MNIHKGQNMMSRKFLVIVLALLSIGAKTYYTSHDKQFEAELEIISFQSKDNVVHDYEEYGGQDVKLFLDKLEASNTMKYMYGWIRLRDVDEDQFTYVPKCSVKVWNDEFKIVFDVVGIHQSRSFFLIPIGTAISNKPFKVKIK